MFREIRTRERITEEDERRKRELGYLSIKPKTEEFKNMSIKETEDMLNKMILSLMEEG